MPPGAKNSWRVGRVRVEVSEEAIGAGAFSIIGPSQTTGDRSDSAGPHFEQHPRIAPGVPHRTVDW